MEVRSVQAIVRALNAANVRYLIVGGLAVNAHGYERLTRDVDLVIGLEPENIIRGLRALFDLGYRMSIPVTPEEFADASNRQAWRNEKNMTVIRLWSDLHQRTPVDVFVYEPFDFAEEYVTATWKEIAEELKTAIVRCETLIAMKRSAARPQDLADAAELEEIQRLKQSAGSD
jgi:predicted nucleotidyltransferase